MIFAQTRIRVRPAKKIILQKYSHGRLQNYPYITSVKVHRIILIFIISVSRTEYFRK